MNKMSKISKVKFFPVGSDHTNITKVKPDTLLQALDQAREIEITTIPLYLYTYYSINRAPHLDVIKNAINPGVKPDKPELKKLIDSVYQLGKEKGLDTDFLNKLKAARDDDRSLTTEKLVNLLAASIVIFANKTAALIYSVLVEEMLHAALVANVMSGLQVKTSSGDTSHRQPTFYGTTTLPHWPFTLPGHIPSLKLNLNPLSQSQLANFKAVEQPSLGLEPGPVTPIPYNTIGGFYDAIIKAMRPGVVCYDPAAPKLRPGKDYYSPNNINSTYYNLEHQPQLANEESRNDLINATDVEEAIEAMELIKIQGEGRRSSDADEKQSHYYKFAEASDQLSFIEGLGQLLAIDLKGLVVYPYPTNPTNSITYSDNPLCLAISTATNAAFTYIFLMLDHCYRMDTTKEKQKELFTSIHKSMMWVISTFCQDLMSTIPFEREGKTYTMAPTFEFYDFEKNGKQKSPKDLVLYEIQCAIDVAASSSGSNTSETLKNIYKRVQTLIDVTV